MSTVIPINQFVNVSIALQQALSSQVNFNLNCVMSEDTTVIPASERYRIYTSLSGVEADFNSSTPEYTYASFFFMQQPCPTQLMIAVVDVTNSETYPTAIAAALALQDFWGIGVISSSLTDTVIESIAATAQANKLIFICQSDDPTIPASGTTDIVSVLKTANYTRTSFWFCDNAPTERLDAAFASAFLSMAPGTEYGSFLSLIGITATSLNSSQIAICKQKTCNIVGDVSGSNLTLYGYTCGTATTYVDQIAAIDYLTVEIEQSVMNRIAAGLPFDDYGRNSIATTIHNVLNNAVKLGTLVGTPKPKVHSVAFKKLPPNDIASRTYSGFTFEATLGGKVLGVVVNGTLSPFSFGG